MKKFRNPFKQVPEDLHEVKLISFNKISGATKDPQVIISHAYSLMVVCKLIETCTCSTTTCYSFWY